MPKPFTEHEKEVIAGRLLEEGFKQFSAYGLKKANVGEIAEAAGISKGAFYGFYESKEALFMDVMELAEERFRQEVLAVVDLPGPSPRARLLAVLRKAFDVFENMPLLQRFTRTDFDVLYRRVPAEKLNEHLGTDRIFIEALIARCQEAGIPIQIGIEEFSSLVYMVILTVLQEGYLGPNDFGDTVETLLELIAAFCLGEVTLEGK